jgi:hypothetical protein
MATPASRQELIDYCLRSLGHPVIEINIDDDQIEDRIDEAFQHYREYHYDAVELVYLKQEVTANVISNQYITLNDSITGVNRVLPFSSKTTSGMDMFDIRYQILVNDLYSIQSTDLIYYHQVRTHLQLIQDLLIGIKPIRFNRHQNRLHVDMDWNNDIKEGEFIIVEAYRILDPSTFTDVYNDGFLKRYATALIKRQWGINLKKFEGVQLPGGVTLNGQKIFDEAMEEIQILKDEVKSTYQLPVDFMTG